jgi:hypothetical protein
VRHPEGENLLGNQPEHKQPSDFGCVLSPAQGEENNQFLIPGRNLIPSTPIDNKHYGSNPHSVTDDWFGGYSTKLHQ